MGGIAISGTDPLSGPAATAPSGRAGAAGLFDDALGAALAGSTGQDAAPESAAPAGDPAPGPAQPAAAALLGAAASLAALLGRAAAGSGSGAGTPAVAPAPGAPSDPATATQVPAGPAGPAGPGVPAGAAGGPVAPVAEAGDPTGTAEEAALSATAGAEPGGAVAPGRSGRDGLHRSEQHDDAEPATGAGPTAGGPDPSAVALLAAAAGATPPSGGARASASAPASAPAPAPAGAAAAGAPRAGARVVPAAAGQDGADQPAPTTPPATAAAAADAVAAAAAPASAPAPRRRDEPAVQQVGPQAAVAPAQPALPSAAPAATGRTLVATTDPTVAQQLQGPLVALRSAPDGDHVLVVRVTPEHLGEVTVHATVSKGDLSVQLFASTAGGHDALRSMLGDLQRDLGSGAAGTTTDLSLGTGTAPQQDQRGQQPAWVGTGAGGGDGRPSRDERTGRTAARGAPVADPSADLRIPTAGSALLDVLA